MLFRPLEIPGVFLLVPERAADRRGYFARHYCRFELERRGLDPTVVRCEVSVNPERGTVRGLCTQAPPYEMALLARCTAGSSFHVVADLRPGSPAYGRHLELELSKRDRHALYVPEGVVHGFQTLEDDVEVFFQMSEFDYPDHVRGVRWNDPALGVAWPLAVTAVSERDRSFADVELADRPRLVSVG